MKMKEEVELNKFKRCLDKWGNSGVLVNSPREDHHKTAEKNTSRLSDLPLMGRQ